MVLGLAFLAFTGYAYVVYQGTEVSAYGASAIAGFALGSYLLAGELGSLRPYRRILPFLAFGGAASLALAVLGLGGDVASAFYGEALGVASSRTPALLFTLAGVSVHVSNDVLLFPGGKALSIGPLCSGAYSSLLFLLVSPLMLADFSGKVPKRRLGAAVAIGLVGANLANVLRIAFLASSMYFFGLTALEAVHQFAGYAVFLGFMTVFWLASLRWLRGNVLAHPRG